MANDKGKGLQIPGSLSERFVAFLWYGVVISLWNGLYALVSSFVLRKIRKIDYEEFPKRTGQVVVLTGGTRGIGFEVLKKLLRLDYFVIFGVRNTDVGLKAIDTIRKSGITSGRAKCLRLDLKSLKSVRRFAENALKEKDRIDLLINNAGIMMEPYELTEDGYEVQFQVNHLSHFLLTQLLLPKIKRTGERKDTLHCRIVNVSSLAHIGSDRENLTDVENPKVYSAFRAYYNSKLCQILVTKYLDSQLKSDGANVRVYALHPGIIVTELYSSLGIIGKITEMLRNFWRSPEDGAEVVMYAATSTEIEHEGGLYIENTQKGKPSKIAEDITLQKMVWDKSEALVS